MKALVITNSITTREEKSTERYLNEIAKFSVLGPDEEVKLFNRYLAGDQSALEEILAHNLRFVVSVAKRYQHLGLKLNDLINEGNIGLIKAAKRFDPTKGFKFISYAVWWIRQSILQAINEKSRKIRLPANHQMALLKILKEQEKLQQKYNREPTMLEIEHQTGFDKGFIAQVLKSSKYCTSLDAPAKVDENVDAKNFMADQQVPSPDNKLVRQESLQIEVQELLHRLKGKEKQVILLSYGIGQSYTLSLEEIGHRLNLSKERVRQIRTKAIRKIRSYIQREQLTFSFN